jgi:3-phytase
MYRGAFGSGYLLASSQGDSTFSAFGDRGLGAHLGTFEVGDGRGIDAVQESGRRRGGERALGRRFRRGLFVTHDGDDVNTEGGDATNFKLVRWQDVARAFDPPLRVDPFGWSPRLSD